METRSDPVRWLSPGSDAPDELRRVLGSASADGGGAGALSSLAAKLPVAGVAAGAGSGGAGVSAKLAGGAVKKAVLSWKLALWVAGAAAAGGAATNALILAPASRPAITVPAQGAASGAGERPAPATWGDRGSDGESAPDAPASAGAPAGDAANGDRETGNRETGNREAGDHGTGDRQAGGPGGANPAIAPRTAAIPPARQPLAEGAPPSGEKAVASRADEGVATVDSLGAEARLLLDARRAMARDPQKALREAESHDASFGGGALAEERDVLRIEALVKLGRLDEAAGLAASFRARHPQSSHLARIDRLLRSARATAPR